MLIHTRIRPNICTLAAVVLLAAALTVLAPCGPVTATSKPSPTATETIAVPPGWSLYSDPDSSFRLAVPPGWTVTRGTASHGYGGPSFYVQVPDSETTLIGPYASMYFEVSPVSTDYRRYVLCPHWQPNTTLAGLPTQNVATGRAPHYWIIDRNDEQIMVQYNSPLDPSMYMGPTPPTPIPTATAGAVVNDLEQMLASLRIKPDAPIAC